MKSDNLVFPMEASQLARIHFETYEKSVRQILEISGANKALQGAELVIIKPNLVCRSEFPVTTHPELCRRVIEFILEAGVKNIVIAEGTGDPGFDTLEIFDHLGYTNIAMELGVELIDLNSAPLVKKENPHCRHLTSLWIPQIADNAFIFSLPVLKAHSLSGITGTIKNMMGFLPPKHYNDGGSWNKAALHKNIQSALSDLSAYILPDFTLMDASVGLSQWHLGGPTCDPPPKLLIAGTDPFAIDQEAARLIGIDPATIGHLNARLMKDS